MIGYVTLGTNDFARASKFYDSLFFRRHSHIRAVFFNGAKAEQAFRRHVLPLREEPLASLRFERLPSTSPAHASRGFQHKLREWRRIKKFLEP